MAMEQHPEGPARGALHRWQQLAIGIVCMVMVANLQYGWTLFVQPMDAKFQWGRAAIQAAFTIFVTPLPACSWRPERTPKLSRTCSDTAQSD